MRLAGGNGPSAKFPYHREEKVASCIGKEASWRSLARHENAFKTSRCPYGVGMTQKSPNSTRGKKDTTNITASCWRAVSRTRENAIYSPSGEAVKQVLYTGRSAENHLRDTDYYPCYKRGQSSELAETFMNAP